MKTAIVTDSNSGITQSQAEELGLFVLPMPFMINGETFEEDISLTQQEFYGRLAGDADISTSQPSPETVTALWDRLLGEYDGIAHIPMSSGLSSSSPAPTSGRCPSTGIMTRPSRTASAFRWARTCTTGPWTDG